MPRDYHNQPPTAFQRLPEHQRGDEWIRAFLRGTKLGHVSTIGEGRPYLNPTTFWFDEANHRIIFHSNRTGRVRWNIENHAQVCFEASEMGRMLPANVALEFSVQYRSVIVFGEAHLIADPEEARQALYGLIQKYFPAMTAGKDYRPITDKELKRTSVYAIQIESWSGKENWPDRAEQSDEWPALDERWFSYEG
jgi:nitroimidazol reductase NimA-like FMN-containing flavoprotein (pyridoxamine 5'-phosphate oxidase superfamily)